MNAYILSHGGKRYATNADNMMEAEDKLIDYLEVSDLLECQIVPVESIELLEGDESIIFF